MRVVPAKNGWKWLLMGFDLFRKSPAMWLFLVITYYIGITMLGQIRYVGVAASVLLPAFSVSFMVMCAVLDAGGALQPALLFSGFVREPARLITLGVLYLISIFAVLGTASVADGGALLRWAISGQMPPEDVVYDGSFGRALMLATLASTPVLMAFWFAPVLAAWSRMGAAQSLFYSFFAVWRNWRAFLVYGAVLLLAFLTTITVVAMATQGQIQPLRLLALLLTLLTAPTLFASFYASYRDIFPENAVPADHPVS